MQDRQGGGRSVDDSSFRLDMVSHHGEGAAARLVVTGDQLFPKQVSPNGTGLTPENLDELLRAYESDPAARHNGIREFVERYGLTPSRVYKLAFRNGFTKRRGEGGTPILPAEAEKILRDASGLGRRFVHAAINRAMRVLLQYPRGAFGQVTPAMLWKHVRKYQTPSAHRRYQRAHWSPADLELLAEGYREGAAGIRRCVRELMRRHPDWSRDQVHWKACRLSLCRRVQDKSNARRRWSEKEDMTIISLATLKPITSIAQKLDRSSWAVQCRLSGLRLSGRVAGQDYGCEDLVSLLRIGRRKLDRLIGSKKLRCTALRISRRSVDDFLRKQNPNGSAPGIPSGRKVPPKKYYTFQKAAARLGVTPQQVGELLARGLLKPYRPRVSELNLWQFLEKYGWELQPESLEFESLDCEPHRWVKRVPELTPQEAASLAKLRSQRAHVETVRICRYCGRQVRGNALGFHEKRCPQRPMPLPPIRRAAPAV